MKHLIRTRRSAITAGLVVVAVSGIVAAGPVLTGGTVDGAAVVAAEAETPDAVVRKADPAEAPERADADVAGAASERGSTEGTLVVTAPAVLATEEGSASYYANSLAGRRTASGVPYRPRALVAAHRTLPFGTRLRVENLANGRTVEVEVVDRGPFARGRVLDLSRRAAEELGFIRQGHTRVRIEVVEYGDG